MTLMSLVPFQEKWLQIAASRYARSGLLEDSGLFFLVIGLVSCGITIAAGASLSGNPMAQRATTLAEARARFADPPAAFRQAPLYVWNDLLEDDEILRQLDDFKRQGIGTLFIHPRPGLITPYLSQRWLELFAFTAQEAEKRGMKVGIYDENSYPSGFAGGLVPEAMPDSRLHYLGQEWFEPNRFGELTVGPDTIALFRDRGASGESPEHFRLTVNPDGRTGQLDIDGRTCGLFSVKGAPLSGGVGFRSIVGRNAKIDDVRFYQLERGGQATVIAADDFDRAQLGDGWVNESLVESVPAGALRAECTGGVLELRHAGGMRDTWLRSATDTQFEGKTTVFEFRLIETSGDRSHNPSLVVGTKPYRAHTTSGVMLIDIRGRVPVLGPGMLDGEWAEGQVAGHLAPPDLEPVVLPEAATGETRQAGALGLPPGRYLRYQRVPSRSSPWYGGWWYVDLAKPGVGQKFLDVTLGAYDKIGRELYGKTVLAAFTDEPHPGTWSDALLPEFQKLHGYSLLPYLPALWMDTPDSERVRHDYYATMLALYIHNYPDVYRRECDKRGIGFTGHVWEHDWPWPDLGADGMMFASRQDAPGIDCLMNQYSEAPHGQFGNYRASREVASAANQMGRPRVFCEVYGAAGWDLTFQDMKRIGDWLVVGGINWLDPHLSYYTIRGARKRDHPQSFSYHEPWWEAYHVCADYFGRLAWALSSGEERNRLLVLQPTTTAWMLAPVGRGEGAPVEALAERFHAFTIELGARQVEFDLGSETLMGEVGRAEGGRLVVGQRAYECVVLPEGMQNLESSSVRLLSTFVQQGGRVLSWCGAPQHVDGRASQAVVELRRAAGDRWVEDASQCDSLLSEYGRNGFSITASSPKGGRLLHLQRRLADGRLLFLSNCSIEESATASVTGRWAGVERWDAATGGAEGLAAQGADEKRIDLLLPPAGSALLAFYDQAAPEPAAQPKPKAGGGRLERTGDLAIRLESPNVLPLDYVDLDVKGEHAEGLYFYDAQKRIYQAHGLSANPWDSSVQFKDEIIRKDHFAPDSGFTLRYPFAMEGFGQRPALSLVVERGDRYTVSINGRQVEMATGEWWLDRSFRVYRLEPSWLSDGINVVETTARPFSLFDEPEPVYLLGDFQLASASRGFVLRPPQPLRLGAWSEQGRPCYPGVVRYVQHYAATGQPGSCRVKLADWKGTVAKVEVNGKPAGFIAWQPWELDISSYLKPGENEIAVLVYGSLKNLLGPHHAGEVRGSAWPNMFWRGGRQGQPPGSEYDVLPYGLMAPFNVVVD